MRRGAVLGVFGIVALTTSAVTLACVMSDAGAPDATVVSRSSAEQQRSGEVRADPAGIVAPQEVPVAALEEAGEDLPSAPPPPHAADAEKSATTTPLPATKKRDGGAMGRAGIMAPPKRPDPSSEAHDHIEESDFIAVADDARSTFSIDVDTASYANVRRMIEDGSLPPVDAVRIEELVNYFSYDYESPIGSEPFSMNAEVSATPWNRDNLLVSIGLQGKVIDQSEAPTRNLVFLLDVSGSMNDADRLPLLKRGLALLVENLRADDKVSIVVYAGASGVVLEPTAGTDKQTILDALARLEAGGSTNGGEGIHLAYAMAKKSFVKGGINRVILATDGDFNVGVTSRGELMRLIEDKRESGVFLSVLGFGTGNVKDSTMEQIADKGNGNYSYIDSIHEAKKVLVEEAGATLVTIAKDVKIQVEFNPAEVASYRLIGYENRKLEHDDFNDDDKDAGEIGAGHAVTALYEIVPAGTKKIASSTDKLKYQEEGKLSSAAGSGELMTVKIRYKQPDGGKSKLLSFPVVPEDKSLESTSDDYRFAAAVAEYGMLLRNSSHRADASYDEVMRLAKGAIGSDAHGHRRGFLDLVEKTQSLADTRGPLARAE